MLKRYVDSNSRIKYQYDSTDYFVKTIWFDGYENWFLEAYTFIELRPGGQLWLTDTLEWQRYRREITKLITEYHERNRIISRSRNS